MSSIRKRQLEYFKNLNQKNFAGNKLSWNLIKPFFQIKGQLEKIIPLLSMKRFQTMIKKCLPFSMVFFSSIFSNINVPQYQDVLAHLESIIDSLEIIREKYKTHPSILTILHSKSGNSFSFNIIPNIDSLKERH